MANIILRIMINALSIGIAVKVIDGITFTGEWWKMIIIGAVFGVVNAFIKPMITFFALPLIIFTLGLFTLFINTLMLIITVELSEPFKLGLSINGFLPAFKGAIVISIVSILLSWLSGINRIKIYKN